MSLIREVFTGMGETVLEVLGFLVPLTAVSVFVQIRSHGYDRDQVRQTLTGFMFLFVGVVFFLQGVTVGFFPAAVRIGRSIAGTRPSLLLPVGFILGVAATLAEPAVQVLMSQVDEESGGSIRRSHILFALSVGVGMMVTVGMARIVYGIPFKYIIVPGYILAMLLLKRSDPAFVALAFDSGGVATGPMAVAFLSSLAVGASFGVHGETTQGEGFGIIALIALAPMLSVMLLGLVYSHRRGKV